MDDRDGYWGKVSSTIQWCEENYVVSDFIAEFWNTISNLMMIIPPLVMMRFAWKDKIETRFIMSLGALATVGVGSWLFHMTLLYSMQLMDEMPMVWGTIFLLYSLYEMASPKNVHNYKFLIFLVLYCFIYTGVYIYIRVPLFHQVTYGIMVFGIGVCLIRIYRTLDCSISLAVLATITYLLGFILWNIDNQFCGTLRQIRHNSPYINPITQLHAWWHVLAGAGTYATILFTIQTRLTYLKRKSKFTRAYGTIPCIRAESPV